MKLLLGFLAVLGLSAASAMAGDGRLSNQSLAKVGLVGMQVMSDSQGLEIRGLGVLEGDGGPSDHHFKEHHLKEECKTCHDKKCHEESCHHQESCHSTCHIQSLCQVHCAGRAG